MDRPLRVAVLCSRRAPGLRELLSLDRRDEYEIVCVVSSEATPPDVGLDGAPPPVMFTHDIRAFYAERSSSVTRDFVTRRLFDRNTAAMLSPFAPDLVLLDGYLYLLTRPMLEAFRNRILNLHFSDLTIRRADRRPAYIGIHAVRDAIADGQEETSATIHLVNGEPDGGAPLVRSWTFPVSPLATTARAWQAADMLKAYAFAHQEWMLRDASAPLIDAALRLVLTGRIDLDAVGALAPDSVSPWIVDERGRLTPPAALRMHEILRAYRSG